MLNSLGGGQSLDNLSPEMKKTLCDEMIKGFNEDKSGNAPDLETAMTIVKSTYGYKNYLEFKNINIWIFKVYYQLL